MCELSDHSHQGVSSSDLTERDGFTYTAIKVNYYKNGKFTVPPNYRNSRGGSSRIPDRMRASPVHYTVKRQAK